MFAQFQSHPGTGGFSITIHLVEQLALGELSPE